MIDRLTDTLRVNGEAIVFPYSRAKFLKDFPQVSLGAEPSDESLAEFGVYRVTVEPQPSGDVIELQDPALVNGAWVQQWAVRSHTAEEVEKIRSEIIESAYNEAARRIDILTMSYASSERDSWTAIYEEAKACKTSGYTSIGEYMQAELDATVGLTAQDLADRVIANAQGFITALSGIKAKRTALVATIAAASDPATIDPIDAAHWA